MSALSELGFQTIFWSVCICTSTLNRLSYLEPHLRLCLSKSRHFKNVYCAIMLPFYCVETSQRATASATAIFPAPSITHLWCGVLCSSVSSHISSPTISVILEWAWIASSTPSTHSPRRGWWCCWDRPARRSPRAWRRWCPTGTSCRWVICDWLKCK